MKITIDTTPQVGRALERLLHTGLYGGSIEEAAERLLCRAIEDQRRDQLQPIDEGCPANNGGPHFPGCGCD